MRATRRRSASDPTRSHSRPRWPGSRPAEGSSSSSTRGRARSASATLTRWRFPPERRSTRSVARSRQPGLREHLARRPPRRRPPSPDARTAAGSAPPRAARRAPAAGAPSRLRCAARPMARRSRALCSALHTARIDSRVVLPAPLGPTTATSSPAATVEVDRAQGVALRHTACRARARSAPARAPPVTGRPKQAGGRVRRALQQPSRSQVSNVR